MNGQTSCLSDFFGVSPTLEPVSSSPSGPSGALVYYRAGRRQGGDVSRRHKVMDPLDDFEARYLAHMAAEGLSPETVRQRVYLLRGLGKPVGEVTQDDIVSLINSRDLSAHSRAKYVTVLKATYSDLLRMGLVDHDPTARMKTPRTARRSPRPITDAELKALETLRFSRPREYAWTILGAYAGLRAGEVCSIAGTALEEGQHGPELRVVGKGGVEATIPAHAKVVAVMREYARKDQAIWPMWPSSLDRAWKIAAESVGVEGRVFHQLRHTFATRLTRSGVDLLVIANLCRHASVATTQKYAQVADDAPFQAVVGL